MKDKQYLVGLLQGNLIGLLIGSFLVKYLPSGLEISLILVIASGFGAYLSGRKSK